MKKRPCPKHAIKDPFMVLADLRRRQEKMQREALKQAEKGAIPKPFIALKEAQPERYAAAKSKIAHGWEQGNLLRMGAINNPGSFDRLFYPTPGPMPDILKANHNGW